MYGFEAIEAHNGWAMALAGILIVLSGLAVLSFVISQLHRLVAFWQKKPPEKPAAAKPTPPAISPFEPPLLDIEETAELYRPFLKQLGDEFELSQAHQLFQENRFPHPHLTIRRLREAGFILTKSKGLFTWKD